VILRRFGQAVGIEVEDAWETSVSIDKTCERPETGRFRDRVGPSAVPMF